MKLVQKMNQSRTGSFIVEKKGSEELVVVSLRDSWSLYLVLIR